MSVPLRDAAAPGPSPGAEPTRLLVCRHGETDWNVALRIQGSTDIPLNATGLAQAARLGSALAGEGLAAVYASDLARAAQTAAAVGAACGLAVRLDAGLRERAFGRFEGFTFHEIEARWPEEALRWRRREPGFAPGGGESLEAFSARAVGAVRAIAARHPGEAVAVVAHGGVLDCLYRAATRIALDAPRSWTLGNAAINRLLASEGGLALVGWNDDAHLDGERDASAEGG